MKKFKSILLLSLLSAALLATACSNKNNDNNDKSTDSNKTNISNESTGSVGENSNNENDSSTYESNNNENATNESPDNDNSHEDIVIVEREYEYDFEGKYWYAQETNEAIYFNGFQYIYVKDGEVLTSAYDMRGTITLYEEAYSFSSNEVKRNAFILDYELKDNSLILSPSTDSNSNTDNSISFTEITREEFNNLTKMNFDFIKIPKNSYWKAITPLVVASSTDIILHFDGTTLISYENNLIEKQKYGMDNNSIILEPTATRYRVSRDIEENLSYPCDIPVDYSLCNNILIINDIFDSPAFINTERWDIIFLPKLFIQIDEETAKNIINKNYVK